jgi:hypothetical protein
MTLRRVGSTRVLGQATPNTDRTRPVLSEEVSYGPENTSASAPVHRENRYANQENYYPPTPTPTIIGVDVGAVEPDPGSTVMAKVLASIPVGSGGLTRAALP